MCVRPLGSFVAQLAASPCLLCMDAIFPVSWPLLPSVRRPSSLHSFILAEMGSMFLPISPCLFRKRPHSFRFLSFDVCVGPSASSSLRSLPANECCLPPPLHRGQPHALLCILPCSSSTHFFPLPQTQRPNIHLSLRFSHFHHYAVCPSTQSFVFFSSAHSL